MLHWYERRLAESLRFPIRRVEHFVSLILYLLYDLVNANRMN